jgi:hypothetical protein
MIRHVRIASLLVAFYVLTLTATAYAECAWVLWLVSWPNLWGVEAAYSLADGGQAACERAATKGNKRFEKDPRARAAEFRLQCLPDTVDPRGPKGK